MATKNYFQHEKALIGSTAQIGENTRIWAFANIQDGAVIGRGCNICDGCFVEKGAVIGDNVTLKNGVNIFEGIVLEDDVFCGPHAAFINDRYPRSFNKDTWVLEKTIVKKGATIGCNATVLCGMTIGRYAFIGAGSVVTKDVGDFHIVRGNPARFTGYVCRCGKKLNENLICSCGCEFTLSGDRLELKG